MAAKASARGSFAQFHYGFHAIPSMAHLHLHVISQDFISDSLKTVGSFSSPSSERCVRLEEALELLHH